MQSRSTPRQRLSACIPTLAALCASLAPARAQSLSMDWVVSSHSGPVCGVAVADNASRFLTFSEDGTARAWQPIAPRMTILPGPSNAVLAGDVSFDGARAAYSDLDGGLFIWSFSAASLTTIAAPAESVVRDMRFTTDGLSLVTAGEAGARVRSATNGAVIRTLVMNGPANAVNVSTAGTALIGGGTNVRLFNIATGAILRSWTTSANVVDVALSRDGAVAAAASGAGGLTLWNTGTGAVLANVADPIGALSTLALNQTGTVLFAGDIHGQLRRYNAASGALVGSGTAHFDRTRDLRMVGPLPFFASSGDDGWSRAWDANTALAIGDISSLLGGNWSASISPAGRVAITGKNRLISVFDTSNGAAVRYLIPPDQSSGPWTVWGDLTVRRNYSACVQVSNDGTKLASGSYDGEVKLWDLATGAQLLRIPMSPVAVTAVRFSAAGNRVFAGSTEGTLSAFDSASGALVWTQVGLHAAELTRIALSPDGSKVVSAAFDGSVRVSNAANGQTLLSVSIGPDSVEDVLFTPNGAQIVTAGSDGDVSIWRADNGLLVANFAAPGKRATALASATGPDRLLAAYHSGEVAKIDLTALTSTPVSVPVDVGQLIGIGWLNARVVLVGNSGTVAGFTPTNL